MARDSYREFLASVPLFAHCNARQLDHVIKVVDEVVIPAGTAFVKEGHIGREMFIIIEGTAEVTRDGRSLAKLGPNDFVGELAVLRRSPRNATVTATTDLTVLVLTANAVEPLLDDIPGLAKALLLAVVGRVDGTGDDTAG
jgi:CRP/FNR family transcriptional regulator, cyclic AMP receptor protein